MNFVMFNLIEGLFWIVFGIISAAISFMVSAKYKRIAFASTAIFILFGISDFVEIAAQESFLDTLPWLLLWKISGVIGIIFVITWYIKLRTFN